MTVFDININQLTIQNSIESMDKDETRRERETVLCLLNAPIENHIVRSIKH